MSVSLSVSDISLDSTEKDAAQDISFAFLPSGAIRRREQLTLDRLTISAAARGRKRARVKRVMPRRLRGFADSQC
jgi:hypothetical protein